MVLTSSAASRSRSRWLRRHSQLWRPPISPARALNNKTECGLQTPFTTCACKVSSMPDKPGKWQFADPLSQFVKVFPGKPQNGRRPRLYAKITGNIPAAAGGGLRQAFRRPLKNPAFPVPCSIILFVKFHLFRWPKSCIIACADEKRRGGINRCRRSE